MIDKALECIQQDVNAQLGGRDSLHPLVTLSHLVNSDGGAAADRGGVVLILTGIEEERNVAGGNQAQPRGGMIVRPTERAFVNLHIMFAATQPRYDAALAAIGAIVGYLKAKPVFDARNTPRFPAGLGQLTLTMEKLDYGELSNLWGYLGTSYVPSVNYTVRMVVLGTPGVGELVPPIEAVEVVSSS